MVNPELIVDPGQICRCRLVFPRAPYTPLHPQEPVIYVSNCAISFPIEPEGEQSEEGVPFKKARLEHASKYKPTISIEDTHTTTWYGLCNAGQSDASTSSKHDCCDPAIYHDESLRQSVESDQEHSPSAQSEETNNSDSPQLSKDTYFVHSFLLSLHSTFFRSLFVSSGMKETTQNTVHLCIETGEALMFRKLLKIMYSSDAVQELSPLELLKIVILADRYCCDLVVDKCIVEISKEKMNVKDLNHAMEIVFFLKKRDVFKKHVHILEDNCLVILLETFSPLEQKISSVLFLSFEPS